MHVSKVLLLGEGALMYVGFLKANHVSLLRKGADMPSITFLKPTCSCDHAHYFEVPVVINVFVSLGKAGVLTTTKVYFDKLLKSKSKLW